MTDYFDLDFSKSLTNKATPGPFSAGWALQQNPKLKLGYTPPPQGVFGWDTSDWGKLGTKTPSSNTNTNSFFGDGTELGMNLPTAQLAFGAAQSLSNMWNAYQANKMAKKQFDFTRDFANVNLENQTKQYNTTLADIARTRGQIEGQSQAQQDAYFDSNKLESKRI